MIEWLESGAVFALLLTLCAYEIGLLCSRKWKHSLANPLLIAIILVMLVLKLGGFSTENYQQGSSILTYWLTPATVCFAIPLYTQIKVLRKHLKAIFVAVAAGTVACLLIISIFALVFHMDRQMYFTLLPKGITTAIGAALADSAGGLSAITTAAIIVTGMLGGLFGRLLCKLTKVTHPIAQGVAYGTASHVMGTSKATEISELAGAASSLSLVIAGLMTAIVIPVISIFVK